MSLRQFTKAGAGPSALLLSSTVALAADLYGAAEYIPPQASNYDFIDLRWGPWVELGGFYVTEESSYGEAGVFVPLMQGADWLAFTELRGKYFEGDLIEGNAMLGYRRMTGSGFNFGGWLGLDVLHTDSDNTFGQVSGGLEALSTWFDARVNGYLPFSDPQAAAGGMAGVVLEGDNIFMIGGEEVALYGVDGEIGARLPIAGNRASLGVYGGGFWFDHDDIDEAVTGGMARVELAVNDVVVPGSQLSAQYKYTDDNVRGERHFVGGRLRIPLGAAPAAAEVSPQWLRMADRIERDVDIVVAPSSGKEQVEDADTDVRFDRVVMTSASDSNDLQTVLSNAGGNSLVIADGIDGTITGNAVLLASQTLQGGGSTIQVRGVDSGRVADFTAPGIRPTIAFDQNAPVLLVSDGTHIAGLDIVGGGTLTDDTFNRGILGSLNMSVVLTDLNLSNLGGAGVLFRDADNSTVVFRNVQVLNTKGSGLTAGGINFDESDNVTVDLTNVTVSNTNGSGISFNRTTGAQVSFNDVHVSDTATFGIDFGGANNAVVGFTEVQVSDTGSAGMNFLDIQGPLTATFADVTFSGFIDDALIGSDAVAPHPTLNGNVIDDTTNGPDLCIGDHLGTLTFATGGGAVDSIEGSACAP